MKKKSFFTLNNIKKNRNLFFWLSLILVFIYCFIVRTFHSKSGLPYIHNWDEPQTASTALQILKTGDLNPHFFNYGTLLIYLNYFVDIFHYLYLMGKPESAESYLTNINDIKINKDTGWHWTISHPSFYYWNKMVTVVLGTGTVIFTYFISKNVLENRWLGLLSAAFLSVLGFHITQSSLITTDAPVAFFVLGSVYFSLLFFNQGFTKYLIISLVFCGLASATKYNSSLSLLLPLLVVVIKYFKEKNNFKVYWLVLLPSIPLVTFLIAMPYVLLDTVAFLKGIGYEVRHYKVLGHGSATSQPGLEHIYFQLGHFQKNLGTLGFVLAGIGLFGFFYRPKLLIVLLFPILFFLYMTQMTVNFHRNFVQVYPFLAILVASSVLVMHGVSKWALLKFTAHGKNISPYTFSALFVLYVGYLAYDSWATSAKASNSIETRSQAILEANKENQVSNIIIAKELRIHEQDLKKLKLNYQIKSVKEIKSCLISREKTALMLPTNPSFFHKKTNTEKYQDSVRANNAIISKISDNNILSRIGGERPLRLDILSKNPGIIIAKINNSLPCSHPEGTVPRDHMLFSKQFPVNEEEIIMPWNGMISLPAYKLGAGTHLLRIENKGNIADGINAEIKVTVTNKKDNSDVNYYRFFTKSDYTFENILINIETTGDYTIKVAFINDFINKKSKEDRNAYIRDIALHTFNPKPDGTAWNDNSNLIIKEKVLFSTKGTLTKKIGFSLDQNDQYELCAKTTQAETSRCKIFGPASGPGGLKNYTWELQSSLQIESLTINPVNGDGRFAIGHIKLHPFLE